MQKKSRINIGRRHGKGRAFAQITAPARSITEVSSDLGSIKWLGCDQTGKERAVGTALIPLGPAFGAISLCRGRWKRTLHKPEVQIGNSGYMTIDSKSLTVFFRSQGIYLFLAFVVTAIFWAIGQPINPFTVILYSLCIGNFLSPPMQWLHVLYEKPSPYDWLIFLAVLCVVMFPVYALSTVIVWWFAPPGPQSLWHLLSTGWKMPFLITFVYGVMNFLYGKTRARLERRNVELQRMVQSGAARLEIHEQELQRASEIQHSLLPKEIPQLPGIAIATAWRPARAVGGDYFDVLRLDGNRVASALLMFPAREFPPLCLWLMSKPAYEPLCAIWIVQRACAVS